MIEDSIIEILKHILINKYKMSPENVEFVVKEYVIDDTLDVSDWAEIIYYYETM